MWKQLAELLAGLVSVAKDTRENKTAIAELRREMHELAGLVEALSTRSVTSATVSAWNARNSAFSWEMPSSNSNAACHRRNCPRTNPEFAVFLGVTLSETCGTEEIRSRNNAVTATGARPSGRRNVHPQRRFRTTRTRTTAHHIGSQKKQSGNSLTPYRTHAPAA